jgi:hypothetical protein
MASGFGQGLKRTADGAPGDAPAPSMQRREATKLKDWNFPLMLEMNTKVEDGTQGDKFIKINEYQREEDAGKPFGTVPTKRVEIAIGRLDTDPDKHTPVRMPFDAGIPKQNGQELGTAWGGTLELKSDEEFRNYAKLEKHVIDKMAPMRHELLPSQSKKAGKANFTAERFATEFNSKLVAADPTKGYKSYLRIHVESDPSRTMPVIRKVHRKGGKFTRPIPGTIHDLKKGSVGKFKIALVRGAYGGKVGTGLKFTLTDAMLIENERETGAPGLNTSGMEFLDEDTPADGADASSSAGKGEVEDLENGSVSASLQEQFQRDTTGEQ